MQVLQFVVEADGKFPAIGPALSKKIAVVTRRVGRLGQRSRRSAITTYLKSLDLTMKPLRRKERELDLQGF